VVFAIEALGPFGAVLEFKLDFGMLGIERKGDLINSIGREAEVCPPQHELVSFVLQLVLTSSEELYELLPQLVRTALGHRLLEVGPLKIIGHQREGRRLW